MAFQTKRFVSIVASMVNRLRLGSPLLTDYSVGAVNRVMLEAPAQEIDELYQQMVNAIVEAVPVATYRSFSFSRQAAQAAGGSVRMQVTPQTAPVIIRAGGLLTTPANAATYQVEGDVSIAVGASFADVPILATVPGLAANVPAGTGFVFNQPPTGFLSASNLVALTNGLDQETDDERQIRFTHYIASLARGTLEAVLYGAKDNSFLTDANGNRTEVVRFAQLDEPWTHNPLNPVGLFNLYIHNGTGGTSAALVDRTRLVIYGERLANGTRVAGYKSAGVQANVLAATEQLVPLIATLTVNATADRAAVIQSATDAIAAYILGLDIGVTCIVARIEQIVMDLPGVYNCVLAVGTVDVPAAIGVKLMPGAIVIPA